MNASNNGNNVEDTPPHELYMSAGYIFWPKGA